MGSNTHLINQFKLECQGQGAQLSLTNQASGIQTYQVIVEDPDPHSDVILSFRVPAINVRGVWKSHSLLSKRLQADWELDHLNSRVSVDAPVVCVFTHDDRNFLTFALQDAVNLATMNAIIREEDGFIYGFIQLLKEPTESSARYTTEIRVDFRQLHFSETLQAVGDWWRQTYPPLKTPVSCYFPIYSTWYSYHQDLDPAVLLEECRLAFEKGYRTIIVDDGWQTEDNNRGYDFTGDWEPDRIPDMRQFVSQVHELGMKFMMWYSVPFCGKKSAAYKRFKGRFLTENHRWAPVFDPRYPEVRSYLISKYVQAVEQWDMDGLKLDFIDDFKVYPETDLALDPKRDFTSVNQAVYQLLKEIVEALQSVKSELMIEFRQQYTGPAVRQYGNMIRAFDCPHDGVTNRVRTADIKLLGDQVATHSDMITWNYQEPVQCAALQLACSIFSVPQISVRFKELPTEHVDMIGFYTQYWLNNQQLLMKGQFKPHDPLLNYPIVTVSNSQKTIVGWYHPTTVVLPLTPEVDLVNGTLNEEIVLKVENPGSFSLQVWNCMGEEVDNHDMELSSGLIALKVPPVGIVNLQALN